MKQIKSFNGKNDILKVSALVYALAIIFGLNPSLERMNISLLGVFCIIFLITQSILHEHLHVFMARLLGKEGKVSFKNFKPCYKVEGILKWNEVVLMSIFPFLILTIIYLGITMFFYNNGNMNLYYFFKIVTMISFCFYWGDFGYIYYAIQYRKQHFIDTGSILEICQS